MHRLYFGVLGIIAVLVIGSAAIVFGESEEKMVVPMGIITLSPPDSVEARRSDVEFPHATHFGFDCKTCHHKWEGPEVIQGCRTSGCHDVTVSPVKAGSGTIPEAESIKYYKSAYHQLCIGCHKEMKRVNKELEMSQKRLLTELPATGPTGCFECHPKE